VLAARLFFAFKQPKKTMTSKIPCQECGVNIEFDIEDANQMTPCPACGNQMRLTVPVKHLKMFGKAKGSRVPGSEIKRNAERFEGIALLVLCLGGFSTLLTIGAVTNVDQDRQFQYLIIGCSASGSLFALAVWLYLLAQIIYIRANTQKD
jgi:hypothetical protein